MNLFCYHKFKIEDLDEIVRNEYNDLINRISQNWQTLPQETQKKISNQIIFDQHKASNNSFSKEDLKKWRSSIKHQLETPFRLNVQQLFKIHEEALSEGPSVLRNHEMNMVIQFAKALDIPRLLPDIFEAVQREENPVIAAALLGHDLLTVHPFTEGNGRSIRLFVSYFLISKNCPPLALETNIDFLVASSLDGPMQNPNQLMLLTIEALQKAISYSPSYQK